MVVYAKSVACPIRHGGAAFGASSAFSSLSSFISFLPLIPIECCGTWVYVLSFLSGLIGAGASGFLLNNELIVEAGGLGAMLSQSSLPTSHSAGGWR